MSRRRELVYSVAAGIAILGWAGAQFFDGPGSQASSRAMASTDFAALKNFDRIVATGPHEVVVTQGSGFSVQTRGGRRAIDTLTMTVVNGELRIGRRERERRLSDIWTWWGSNGDDHDVTITVTLPVIRGASQVGSGEMRIDRATGDTLDIRLMGSGDIRVNAVKVGQIRSWLAGSGDISLSGSAENAQLWLKGSGDIDGRGLTAGRAEVSVAGSGDVTLASDGKASVSLMGSGDVRIVGGAECSITKKGSGEVECG